ncbi:MAG: glutathione peroxidase [Myxococcota bacterium]
MATSLFDIEVRTLAGEDQRMYAYRGRVLLIVNTASRCGFTPQYAGLETLHQHFEGAGLSVLGFPCNQFARQEPGDSEVIRDFCDSRYGVNFPIFEKIEVNGPGTHPLYQHLKAAAPGLLGTRGVKWNFTKFLVARDGKVLRRAGPRETPASLEGPLRKALARD